MPIYRLSKGRPGKSESACSLKGHNVADAVDSLISEAQASGVQIVCEFIHYEDGTYPGFVFAHIPSGFAVVQPQILGEVYCLVRPHGGLPNLEPLPDLSPPIIEAIVDATENLHDVGCRCEFCIAVHVMQARTPDMNSSSVQRSILSFLNGLNRVPSQVRAFRKERRLCTICGVPAMEFGDYCDRHWATLVG